MPLRALSSRQTHPFQLGACHLWYSASRTAPLPQQPPSTKLLHGVHTPAWDANIVPSLVDDSLLSTSKFAAAGYTAFYNKDEVNFYDACTTKITVSLVHPPGLHHH